MPHKIPISDKTQDRAVQSVMTAPEGHIVTFTRKVYLRGSDTRGVAARLIRALRFGWIMSIAKPNRTQEQNDKLWAMLTDLSHAKPEGRKCTPDDWKCLVMNACGHDVQFMEGLDGKPFPTGFRSSRLTIGQMSDLIEWIYAYGADNGVQWSEPKQKAA